MIGTDQIFSPGLLETPQSKTISYNILCTLGLVDHSIWLLYTFFLENEVGGDNGLTLEHSLHLVGVRLLYAAVMDVLSKNHFQFSNLNMHSGLRIHISQISE